VKGSRRRWVKSRPDVPDIWPVKFGTNLTKKEILALENAGFHLPQRAVISLRRLFGGDIPIDVASYPTPPFLDDHQEYPKEQEGANNKTCQQLCICSYLEGPCVTDHDNSSS
jgi:hypothetical protein